VADLPDIDGTATRRRRFAYVALFVVLFFAYLYLRDSTWRGDIALHTLMEAVATVLALAVGSLALVRYYSKKDNTFLFIGTGFVATAFLDGYHTVVSSFHFIEAFPSAPPSLIAWSWLASRIFLSLLLWMSWLFWRREDRLGAAGRISEKLVYSIVTALALMCFAIVAFVPMPAAYYQQLPFPRPQEFLPALFFLLALIGYLRKGKWKTDVFEHWLVLSLIVGFMGQAMFMSFSGQVFDMMFDAAHLLKNGSYICALLGLLFSMQRLFSESHAKQELQFKNTILATQMEVSPDAILVVDEHGKIISYNRYFVELWGLTQEILAARVDESVLHSVVSQLRDPETFLARVEYLYQHRSEDSHEEIDLRDGRVIDRHSAPMIGEHGKYYGRIWFFRDITERKQMETELRESELAHRTLAQNLPGIVYREHLRESGRMQFYNDMPVQITGYAEDELMTGAVCSIEPLILNEDRPGVEAEVMRALEQKRAFVVKYRLKHKDGGIRWMEEHGMPVYDTDGAPHYIDGMIFDITEHKQDEIELHLFRTLVDNSSDAIEVVDPATMRLLDVNQTQCRKLGYSREQLLSMSITDIDSELTADHMKEIQTQLLQTGEARFESTHRRKDDTTYPVEVTAKIVEFGRPYLLSIVRDITERRLAEAEVLKLQEQLREQAQHDPLTGLYNRRYLEETMGREIIRAERYGQPIGVVICDLDYFKLVNDTYGHLVGDEVLRAFAELLRTHSRGSDIVCRFGGEEFLLLLFDTPPDIAYQRAEELRASLAAQQIGKSVIRVTASFGVASYPVDGKTQDELISAVDAAMYQAKKTGRNRVVVASAKINGVRLD
jgi:diguanylate cyclase (GGDEF)-like protein/PAS domain S-box-containing protein